MNKITGVYLEVTSQCNQNCPYCYNAELMKTGGSLDVQKAEELIVQFEQIGIKSFTISGGEPFLYRDLPLLLKCSKEHNLNVTVISNGSCFLQENLEVLLEYSPTIQLSFDGYDEKTNDITRGSGSFRMMTDGYRRVKGLGYHGAIAIRINLYQGNVTEFERILSMIEGAFFSGDESNNVVSITPAFLHRSQSFGEQFKGYIAPSDYGKQLSAKESISKWNAEHKLQIKDITWPPDLGCPFNGESGSVNCGIRITFNGDVFPCQLFGNNEYRIGNIYNSSLYYIINSQEMDSFLSMIHARRQALEECPTCAFRGLCGGGCPGLALSEYGSINKKTDRCAERKILLEGVVLNNFNKVSYSHK